MGDNAVEQIQYPNKNNITVHIMSRVLWWNSVLWYSPQRMGDNAEGQTVARRRYKSRPTPKWEQIVRRWNTDQNTYGINITQRAEPISYQVTIRLR